MLDCGGDVGGGLLNLVLEDVAEAEGLSDFGNAVVDHPDLVAVTEAVEGESGLGWFKADGGIGDVKVAVGGGAEGSAGEVAASVPFEVGGDEDLAVVVSGQVPAQEADEERGQADGAFGLVGFEMAEVERTSTGFVEANVRIQVDRAGVVVVELDVAAVEASEFAPAGSGPAAGDDEDNAAWSVLEGDLVSDMEDFGWFAPDLAWGALGAASASAGAVCVTPFRRLRRDAPVLPQLPAGS